MFTGDLIDGLLLLKPYYHYGNTNTVSAMRDVIIACATDRPLSDEDIVLLVGFGWSQHNTNAGIVTPDNYQQAESWYFYV